jgi:hypothetical protein
MTQRRTEQGHDPVAHDLVDGPLIAVDGLHHVFEDRVEQLASLFRIAVGEQLHRALQVCEEDRDLLALTFQCGLGGEDLLDQMFGSIGLGSPVFRGPVCLCEPRPALATKFLGREIGRPARRTRRSEPGSALATELLAGGVPVPALRALHAAPSKRV